MGNFMAHSIYFGQAFLLPVLPMLFDLIQAGFSRLGSM
jgi:hypothetical protein